MDNNLAELNVMTLHLEEGMQSKELMVNLTFDHGMKLLYFTAEQNSDLHKLKL